MKYSDHLKAVRPCADSSVRGVYVKKRRGARPGFSNFYVSVIIPSTFSYLVVWFATTTRYGAGPRLSRKSGAKKHFPLTAGSDDHSSGIKRRVSCGWLPAALRCSPLAGIRQRPPIGGFSAGGVPARIRSWIDARTAFRSRPGTSQGSEHQNRTVHVLQDRTDYDLVT